MEDVPGITRILGDRWKSQASATCMGVSPSRVATSDKVDDWRGVNPASVVKDGTQIYHKDWGTSQSLFFHYGWPLSAADWDAQMITIPFYG
jgi:hypothetical protein